MRIGISGTGSMGGILARHLAKLCHHVSIANSRGPESLTALAAEIGATPVSVVDADKAAEIVDTRSELNDQQTLAVYGTDAATATREAPGMSAFALEDGVVYHTYSAYIRGLDSLWGMYQWLDRAPRGRNETVLVPGMGNLRGGVWLRRHDEYDSK